MKFSIFLSALILLTNNLLIGQTTTSNYYFAHSLIWHEKSVNNQANIPYWLAEMEKAAGDICLTTGKFAAGQFGAAALPPSQTWSFYFGNDNHGSAMLPNENYRSGLHDNVVLTYMNWEIVYDWGASIGNRIPATIPKATQSISEIFNWINTNDPGRNLYLYECWPKIETQLILDGVNWTSNSGNPPNASQWAEYTTLALGHSNTFWKELQDGLINNALIPNVKLIPSSMICAKLWQPGGLLSDLNATNLFVDEGPHGKPSAYFLAAMIVYASQHKKAPTKPFSSHPQIDQRILDRFSNICTFIMSELTAFNFPNGSSRVWNEGSSLSGSNKTEFESNFVVYPNPAKDHIVIDNNKYENMNGYTLKIINTLGATVYTTAINQKTSYINLKDFKSQGIYFVHLIDEMNNTLEIKKIILH